jgi:outer membrane protein OmpA-like peptidoglycan-associated protein
LTGRKPKNLPAAEGFKPLRMAPDDRFCLIHTSSFGNNARVRRINCNRHAVLRAPSPGVSHRMRFLLRPAHDQHLIDKGAIKVNHRSPLHFSSTLFALLLALTLCASVFAQSDVQRQTVAITYPLDQAVSLKFRGTTRLPRLKGEAKVKRQGRRGTRVELKVENLPRAMELGGIYTTYVVWAISPEGRVDNLGEIKRSGSQFIDSKIDVTTPLQSFALIVTAEPHFLVRVPSRMVVLENLPPLRPGDAEVATVNVQYMGNTSDYFRDPRVPDVADPEYLRTPTSLLGARQAIRLARYAGAERDAQEELRDAQAQLELAENGWRLKQPEAEIDAAGRQAISLGARAEEVAEARKAARQRREEIAERDRAVREAEDNAATANQQIADLKAALDREQRARELAERDSVNASQQLRDARTEIARLREEVAQARTEGEEAKIKLARLEGERSAEQARSQATERVEQQRTSAASLKQTLASFGTVRETPRGIVLTLNESIWSDGRASNLSAAAAAKLEPLAALLANNPDYRIVIEAYTDNRGSADALKQLTDERARVLADQFIGAGIEGTRIEASGLGSSRPVASNTKTAGRLRNRRIEITLIPTGTPTTASSN